MSTICMKAAAPSRLAVIQLMELQREPDVNTVWGLAVGGG
jgi:hypothetical protein